MRLHSECVANWLWIPWRKCGGRLLSTEVHLESMWQVIFWFVFFCEMLGIDVVVRKYTLYWHEFMWRQTFYGYWYTDIKLGWHYAQHYLEQMSGLKSFAKKEENYLLFGFILNFQLQAIQLLKFGWNCWTWTGIVRFNTWCNKFDRLLECILKMRIATKS